jgi:hypothetical protein
MEVNSLNEVFYLQTLNSGECPKIVMLCIHLSFFNMFSSATHHSTNTPSVQ